MTLCNVRRPTLRNCQTTISPHSPNASCSTNIAVITGRKVVDHQIQQPISAPCNSRSRWQGESGAYLEIYHNWDKIDSNNFTIIHIDVIMSGCNGAVYIKVVPTKTVCRRRTLGSKLLQIQVILTTFISKLKKPVLPETISTSRLNLKQPKRTVQAVKKKIV